MFKQQLTQSKALVIICSLFLFFSSGNAHAHMSIKPITLSSKIIIAIDGLKIGIDGEKLGLCLKLRKALETMVWGKKNRDGSLYRPYTLNGKSYTIAELAKLVAENKENPLPAAEQKEFEKKCHAIVEQAKKDFDRTVEPFMAYAQGMKQAIFMLIKDSCTQRDCLDSFLLTWGEAPENEDRRLFHEKMVRFDQLDEFLVDLLCFFSDLIHSCPKACKQFKELVKPKA